MINFYDYVKNKKKYHNPNFKKHKIEIPFRGLIIGPSGSMKTNTALNILKAFNNTFENIIICCKTSNEPLYDFLREKIPNDRLHFYEMGEIPEIDDFKECGQTIIIFDDLVLMKDQSKIAEFFIRGRKLGEGISILYLSQSYYEIPKIIRLQSNLIFMKKLNDMKDLKMILREQPVGVSVDELKRIYDNVLKKQTDFLTLDLQTMDDKLRIRKNFSPI